MPPPGRDAGRARHSYLVFVLVLLATSALATGAMVAPQARARDVTLRVMTYNVREDMDPPPRDWRSRRPLMARLLDRQDPDLLGLQEAIWPQVRDLLADMPGYGWIGMGREGGSRDEFMAILYRRDRFEVLEFDHFWLSATPSVMGSKTWGNKYVRMVTWVRFRDRRNGVVFYHVNSHFDNRSQLAWWKGAELLLRRVRAFPPGIPVVFTGDFNVPAGRHPGYDLLTGPDAFDDTWRAARSRGPVYNTYNHWRPPVPGGNRVDWILTRGDVGTRWTGIDTYHEGDRFPSDHYPVLADLTLRGRMPDPGR
ncbi:endonuclease [Actinomadura sp. NBRC 104412]|uniref:endonuclease/exonuclease/phosphatase family protein n=1 Tax=Actinomadura sp. NBRC 104412 TaxID=3032203 RepID=UPI0024A2FEAD|nr:endonuclease/exonuclease/phosphatase family protein [Actinomadura sp. NBRC 104412]GLZ06825.1 endonuclease [Actinomadura sp. NBRC 104412]